MYYNFNAGTTVAVTLDWHGRVNYFNDYRIECGTLYETISLA